jgi:branched-subunit amino acid ABC-type transport system permease component
MGTLLDRQDRFLARPLGATPRALLVIAALLSAAAAGAIAAQADPMPQAVPPILGAFGLLLVRAAVHGRIGSLLDVAVMGVYLGLWAAWSLPKVSFGASPVTVAAAALCLAAAVVVAWRQARSEQAQELRTATV